VPLGNGYLQAFLGGLLRLSLSGEGLLFAWHRVCIQLTMAYTRGGYRAKLDRAGEQLDSLQVERDRWLGTHPYSVFYEFDPDERQSIIGLSDIQDAPLRFGALFGECIHSLRSALDQLAYELAIMHSGDPLPQHMAQASGFPIYSYEPRKGSKQERKLEDMIGGIHPDAQAIIKKLQPYKRGRDYAGLADPASNSLWLLSEFDNTNKHRMLSVGIAANVGTAVGGENVHLFQVTGRGRIEGRRAEIIWFHPVGIDSRKKMNMNFQFSLDVVFEEEPPGWGLGVVETINRIRRYIDAEVLSPLVPFLT